MQVANFTPAFVNVSGKGRTERALSVVSQASEQAKLALIDQKGKVGIAVRGSLAMTGIEQVCVAAAWPTCNYKPVAEYFAARLGEPMVISSRATFESLPDQFAARVAQAKLGKNEGLREDKDGILQMGSKLKLASELAELSGRIVAAARQISAQNRAKADAQKAEQGAQQAIENARTVETV